MDRRLIRIALEFKYTLETVNNGLPFCDSEADFNTLDIRA